MELKEVTDYLGIEVETLDEFKEKFNSQYFTESQVFADKKKLALFTGKTLGSVTENAIKIAKGFGVELKKEDIKDKNIEDVINMSFEGMTGIHNEMLDKLKLDAGKKGDDKYNALKEDFDKATLKITDLETLNNSTATKLTEAEKNHVNAIVDFKKGFFKKDIFNNLPYSPDVDPLKKTGFITTMNEKYKFDFDEKGEPFITNMEGNRIENPKQHGTFKSPVDVLKEEGETLGVIAKNAQAGAPAGAPATTARVQPSTAPTRRLNPKAFV